MPRVVDQTPIQIILAELGRHRDGIGVDALQAALLGKVSRRTLQRRLGELVRDGRIAAQGRTRALRYRLVPLANVVAFAAEPEPTGRAAEAYVPMSTEGQTIQAYVRRPVQQRRPVSYDQGLLEAYAPNRTFYLDESMRAQLHALGRSPAESPAPAGTFARDILARLLIDLSWASSRLEGNTYSRLDTERLIASGQAAEGKDATETQMILNHKAAIELLTGDVNVAVDAATVIALHALLSDGLLRDPMAGGRVRHRAVEISGSVYRPIALPQRLDELFHIVMQMAAEVEDPIEQTFFLMVHLPYLQPFEDVNKRTSRVAANIPLMRAGMSPLSFIDVPVQAYVDGTLGVYELGRVDLLRDVFVWAYERSCQQYAAVRQELVPPDSFRLRYRHELGEAIRAIVQRGLETSDRDIAGACPPNVTPQDHPRFADLVRKEFQTLHEGNVVRFGLRPPELAAWRERTKKDREDNVPPRVVTAAPPPATAV
jgi:hypothetical protein